MLPADARLRRGVEVRAVSRRGARAQATGVTAHLVPHARVRAVLGVDQRAARAAVVVGKPAGSAVVRNRLRRRLRHSLRKQWALLPAGGQLVLRGGPAAVDLSSSALDAAVGAAVSSAAARAERVPGSGSRSGPR